MAMLIALAFFAFRTQFDVTLISDWGNSFWNNGIDPITFIKQLTILIPTDPNILNPPIWYLEWEVKMFIILPLLIPIANRINYKGFPWYVLLLIPIMIYGKGIIPISYMLGYLFGWINSNMDNKWKQIIIRYAFVWVLIGLICLNVSNEVNLPEGLSSFIRVLGACVIVFIVYNVGDSFLASKPILFLGNVSYEFYLIHFPVLLFFRRIVCVPIAYMLITFSVSIISAVIINSLCKNLSGRLIK